MVSAFPRCASCADGRIPRTRLRPRAFRRARAARGPAAHSTFARCWSLFDAVPMSREYLDILELDGSALVLFAWCSPPYPVPRDVAAAMTPAVLARMMEPDIAAAMLASDGPWAIAFEDPNLRRFEARPLVPRRGFKVVL